PFGPSAGALLADATGAGTPVRRVPTVHGGGEACQPEIGMKKRGRIESNAAFMLSRRVAPRPRSGRRAGRVEGPAPGRRAGPVSLRQIQYRAGAWRCLVARIRPPVVVRSAAWIDQQEPDEQRDDQDGDEDADDEADPGAIGDRHRLDRTRLARRRVDVNLTHALLTLLQGLELPALI